MFRQHIHRPFRVNGFLTDIDAAYHSQFDYTTSGPDTTHAGKLNALAEVICENGDDNDWLIFIDGDAFPVSDLVAGLTPLFRSAPLVAVRRLENLGEKHPHPSFCATTIGFWKEIGANWNKGYRWINALNVEETDVGGELLRMLTERNIPWIPLHRSNAHNILPVWYGIYGDLIYHHGAGFRSRGCRRVWYERGLYRIYRRLDSRILNNVVPAGLLTAVRNSIIHPEGRRKRRIGRELDKIDANVKRRLFDDPDKFLASLRIP
ncbi:MAG: hypothetical protein R3301_04880 [Saprospiraceae bacterium]|nr:hypothetical protein [Saprospiraceae bacterium]